MSESPERSQSPQEDPLRDRTNNADVAKSIVPIDEEDENVNPKPERTGIPRTYPLTPSHTGRAAASKVIPATPVTPTRSRSREDDAPSILSRIHTPPSSPPKASSPLPTTMLRQMSTGTSSSPPKPSSPLPTTPLRQMSTGTPARSPWQKNAMPGTGTPLCSGCTKPVYFAEQVKAAGRIFHRPCLKCADCSTSLATGRLSEAGNKLVCGNCYKKARTLSVHMVVGYITDLRAELWPTGCRLRPSWQGRRLRISLEVQR